MEYQTKTFSDGEVLTHNHMNNIMCGIDEVKNQIGNVICVNNLSGKKVSFLGDSITTFAGTMPSGYSAWYPSSSTSIKNVGDTWWRQLLDSTGMVLLKNCSWSGSAVSSIRNNTISSDTNDTAYMGASTKRISDLRDTNDVPDIIIVMIGINDFRLRVPIGDWNGESEVSDGIILNFSEAYALMCQKLCKSYPNAEIFLCTLPNSTSVDGIDKSYFPSSFNHDSEGVITLQDYNNKIKYIADAFGVNIIDMNTCGLTYFNGSSYLQDGLHPNIDGAKLLAIKSIREVISKSKYLVTV